MANQFNPISLVSGSFLTTGVASYYQVPNLSTVQITKLTITNVDSTASHAVSIYLSPNNAAPTATILLQYTLAPGECRDVFQADGHVLPAGGTIQAFADTVNVVAMKASGILCQ